MLTRAARRRQNLRYVQHVADQLQLPFLCPTLARNPVHIQQRSTVTRPTPSRSKTAPSIVTQSRHLASAAPTPDPFDRDGDFTDRASYSTHDPPISQRRTQELPAWQPWDLADIIRIDRSTVSPPNRSNTNQVIGNDIRGNVIEVERNLEACLLLKKWDRAISGLVQLKMLYHTDVERLRFQHNRVLACMADDFLDTQNSDNEERITQWIERDMKRADLEPDAYTFALVIKIALASVGKSKRDRTVRRYWDMAKRYDLQSEVGSLRAILTERDLGLISEICPLELGHLNDTVFSFESLHDPAIDLTEDVLSKKAELQLLEMDQKGLGMSSLKHTLSLFSDAEHRHQLRSEHDPDTQDQLAEKRQRRLERDAIDAAVSRWKVEHEKMGRMGVAGNLSKGKIGALLWQWHEIMTQKVAQEVQKVHEAEEKVKKSPQDRLRVEYGPFLEQMKPEKVAAVTAIALMQIMSKVGLSKSVKLVRLVTELGRTIEAEHQTELVRLARHRPDPWKNKGGRSPASTLAAAVTEPNLPGSDDSAAARATASKPVMRTNHHAAQKILVHSDWTVGIHAKLGAILCELMFDAAKMTITKEDPNTGKEMSIAQPIFTRNTIYHQGKKVGIVSLHESFVSMMVREPAGDVIAKQLPMVSKPRSWTGYREGGYLESDQPVLRVKNHESLQKDYAQAAAARGDLDHLFAGLDVLGQTGWKINRTVFDVMAQAWNSGQKVANLAPLNKVFDIPERPPMDATAKEKFDWYNVMRSIDNEKSGHHSNRCFQNFQMEIAKAYLDETFYLPHNMDFRGRAYPIPPYLNQMGADNCRGLLLFSNGRELGEEGLAWLKVHLSNVFGYDKASLADREHFPMDHIDDIRDSVSNPLDGRRWWLEAEDPWQCLATCHELINALDSPEPAKYMSCLPVHQDGSCNGLQHYAALGGDIAGAKQVNLEPGNKPADVYTGVAELVKAEVAEDAKNGVEVAKLVDGRITRKVVKQTVMTNVYGVTFLGAIRQVRKQIDALMPELDKNQKSGKAATYLARKIFKALASLFTGAHDIQYWLGDCANRITASLSPAQLDIIAKEGPRENAKSVRRPGRRVETRGRKQKDPLDAAAFRTSVIWTTPLKLPVVQPYRINKGHKIQTNLQNISLCEPSVSDSVNKRKQLQAFPPNFIHSLDATHMILSALQADEMGLSFSAVHDSFWTHAADVTTMNKLLREAFIRMHSEDIVGRLAAEFRKRYEGHLYITVIDRSSLLAKAIGKYRRQLIAEGVMPAGQTAKAMKDQRYAELLREIKKRQFMSSDDAVERAEGVGMITASSLFEDFDGERYIASKDSLGETAIGSIPEAASEDKIAKALDNDEVNSDVDMLNTLEPLLDSASADAVDSGETGSRDLGPLHDTDEDLAVFTKQKAPVPRTKQVWLWLPLDFRPVPKKGEFDVNRLRDSQYFFS